MIYDSRQTCINCFADKILRDFIGSEGEIGACDWCGSTQIKTTPIFTLSEMFRSIVDCYDEVSYTEGERISLCLQEDWRVYSPEIEEDPDLIQELTVAILVADTEPKERVDFPDYNGFFRIELPELEFEWFEKLQKMLKGKNPYRDEDFDNGFNDFPDRIEYAIEEKAKTIKSDKIYYRARIHKDRKRKARLSPGEMGAPSIDEAKAGRGNKEKEPVLYLASDDKTALSEVRAWRGMAVALAKVRLRRDVKLIDLTEFHFPNSPFETQDICYHIQLNVLFESFGSALSKPLLPGEEERHYLPSQKLCELIRQRNLDGVIYPSAMGPGKNVLLFNPDDGDPFEVKYVRIGTPAYPITEIDEQDDLYEDWPYQILVEDIN
ncbi:MAG: RES family NAD+ phosphorylase [Methanosarcinaceae archaeon]|nr:RES family NAD+ phosphorylase [Methanosarcinaceae archaeon]